jgi:hypothetical protein
MAQGELVVKIWGDKGQMLDEQFFVNENDAWSFAEQHLFQGRDVTVLAATRFAEKRRQASRALPE